MSSIASGWSSTARGGIRRSENQAPGFLPGNRLDSPRVEIHESPRDFGAPSGFGAFVDVTIEALDQATSDGSTGFWRKLQGVFEDLVRFPTHVGMLARVALTVAAGMDMYALYSCRGVSVPGVGV
jgi:hypothetical protein